MSDVLYTTSKLKTITEILGGNLRVTKANGKIHLWIGNYYMEVPSEKVALEKFNSILDILEGIK
jgi:hypothetical protein